MAVEYSKIGDSVGIDRISELLGGDADRRQAVVTVGLIGGELDQKGGVALEFRGGDSAVGHGQTEDQQEDRAEFVAVPKEGVKHAAGGYLDDHRLLPS